MPWHKHTVMYKTLVTTVKMFAYTIPSFHLINHYTYINVSTVQHLLLRAARMLERILYTLVYECNLLVGYCCSYPHDIFIQHHEYTYHPKVHVGSFNVAVKVSTWLLLTAVDSSTE